MLLRLSTIEALVTRMSVALLLNRAFDSDRANSLKDPRSICSVEWLIATRDVAAPAPCGTGSTSPLTDVLGGTTRWNR